MTAAVALAVVLIPLLALRPSPPEPAPLPGIAAIAGEIKTVPKAKPGTEEQVRAELTAFVRRLYETAFLSPSPVASASPSPTANIGPLFSDRARVALRAHRDVFEAPDVEIRHGRVVFKGVVTLNASKPLEALLDVDFRATGEARDGQAAALRQHGTILASRSSTGWHASGFDLKLETEPAPPSSMQHKA